MKHAGSCPNCGGAADSVPGSFDGTGRYVLDPDGVRGPFVGVDGVRACSEECWEDLKEFAERARSGLDGDWCPACGYDRREHAPDCTRAAAAAPAGA